MLILFRNKDLQRLFLMHLQNPFILVIQIAVIFIYVGKQIVGTQNFRDSVQLIVITVKNLLRKIKIIL